MTHGQVNTSASERPSPPDSGDNYILAELESSDNSHRSNSSPLPKQACSEASMSSARVMAGSRLPSESVRAAGKRLCILTLNEATPTDCCHVVRRSSNGAEVFSADEYKYTFVHLKEHPVRIIRDENPVALPYQAELSPYTVYHPPYSDFPPLLSQVHPYFAIYEAATAFRSLTDYQKDNFLATIPDADDPKSVVSRLSICCTIVDAWKQAFWCRPIPHPRTHLPAPSESRMTTRSRSSRDSVPSRSQPSSTKRKHSDRHASQCQTLPSAAQDDSPSTLASHDSPHTPEYEYEDHVAARFVHENPHLAVYHSDIADWAKDVNSSVSETPMSRGSDAAEQSLMSYSKEKAADNHTAMLLGF
ncbi:hypothetical protein FRC11_011282 [Ceratobasidium sp. 423]|nr:hypothetical protein FRC11_011282 [Ceratobasidium sp. 423]